MPNAIDISIPVDVLPAGLAQAFSFDERLEALDNNGYPDGSSDRMNLATVPRRFFRLTRRLSIVPPHPGDPSEWKMMRDFYFSHIGKSFYFYVARETVPPWKPDPTGAAPDGRYAVVFDSAWTEALALGRSPVDFLLREVDDGSTRTRSDS